MNYPAPFFGAPVAATSTKATVGKVIGVIVSVVALAITIAAAIAIALGVGLGVGLGNDDSNNGGTATRSTGAIITTISRASTTVPTTTISRASTTIPTTTISRASTTVTITTTVTTDMTTTTTTTTITNKTCECSCSPIAPPSLLARIINGAPAIPHSWPWIVALSNNGSLHCGGTLISYSHVLTAAHCLDDVSIGDIVIYAGIQNLTFTSEGQMQRIAAARSHPNYNSVTYNNDIAILKLSSNFTPSANIGISCLPSGNTTLPVIAEKGLIMGWGLTIDGDKTSVSNQLLQAVVDILSSSNLCIESNTQFCAGQGKTDSCQGDSGGPLLTNVDNSWTCTGIVSSGRNCTGVGIYTRVSTYRSFIDQALADL